MKKILYVFIMLLPQLSACTSEYSLDLEGEKEVLAVNVLAEADSTVSASVSHSWIFGTKPSVSTVTDAKVSVSVNGQNRGCMIYDPKVKKYVCDVVVYEGDTVKIAAVSEKYGSAEGSSVVPRKVRIDSWSMDYFLETDDMSTIVGPDGSVSHPTAIRYDYSLTFTDPADEENYYLLNVTGATSSDPILGENDTPLDAVFSVNDEFLVFSDRSIAGKTYTLTFRLSSWYDGWWNSSDLFSHTIRFCSISKDYYLYLLSLHKKYDGLNGSLEELGLAEPRYVYTNVSSGAGIVGAQCVDVVVNDVSEIVKDNLGIVPWQ